MARLGALSYSSSPNEKGSKIDAVAGLYLVDLIAEWEMKLDAQNDAIQVTPLEAALLDYRSGRNTVEIFIQTGKDENGITFDDLATWRATGLTR